jgi:hypothetical protein
MSKNKSHANIQGSFKTLTFKRLFVIFFYPVAKIVKTDVQIRKKVFVRGMNFT